MRSFATQSALMSCVVIASCSPAPAPTTPRPNVLFVSVDTLRADYLGAYGGTHAATPTLDALAAAGVVFEQAVAHVPMTLPSHASMFTSLIPPRHGVRDNGTFVLEQRHETLAELLRASGYHTAAFVGAFVMDAQFGLDQGFDVYDDDVEGTDENDRPADAVLAKAGSWIDNVGNDAPWFAFIHLFDPHAPYQAPAPFDASYRAAPYAGEVAYVDDALGRFLTRLDEDGTLANTLILVTADHGEGLGDHGERTHGMFGYDSTLRVPLILSWPNGIPARRRVASRVRHIDIAPTIAELVGAGSLPSLDGRSLVGLMQGGEEADRASYFESLTYSFNYGSAPLYGLYRDRLKFVSLPIPELYDLDADPGESHNLAGQRSATVRDMAVALDEFLVEQEPVSGESSDSAVRDRLESLGYIAGSNPLPAHHEYGRADDPKEWIHLAEMIDEAVGHHRARRPTEAIQLLRAIIAEKENVAIAYTRLARILHEEGRADEAIAVLEDALASGIQNTNVVTALGVFLREAGDEDAWARVLGDVVATRPGDAQAREALARSLLRSGHADRAVEHLEVLVRLRPQDAAAHSNLGGAYLELRRIHDAEPHLRRAVTLDPTLYETLVRLGLVLIDLDRTDEARRSLEQFVTTAPDDVYREDKAAIRELLDQPPR